MRILYAVVKISENSKIWWKSGPYSTGKQDLEFRKENVENEVACYLSETGYWKHVVCICISGGNIPSKILQSTEKTVMMSGNWFLGPPC